RSQLPTRSLPDALPISVRDLGFSDRFMIVTGLALSGLAAVVVTGEGIGTLAALAVGAIAVGLVRLGLPRLTGPGAMHMALAPLSDRKSTRLNSSHVKSS